MTVKDNQPTLLADLELLFRLSPGPNQDLRTVQHITKAHGRLEKRTLWASTDLKGYLDWPALEQALCLEREVLTLATGDITRQRVYGLTNLAPDQLDLGKVLDRWRGHWAIENREHWVRDVLFAEDACSVHTGSLPHALACFRNAVISLAHFLGLSSIKAARRHFALHLDQALSIVCGSLD